MTANIAARDDANGYFMSPVNVLNFVDILGHKFFTRLVPESDQDPLTFYCKVTDNASGFAVGDGNTEAEAIENARKRISNVGIDRYIILRDKAISEYGRANL